MWCVKHTGGWCATKPAKQPGDNAENVPTACGCFVILPVGIANRKPDCPECLAALARKATRP